MKFCRIPFSNRALLVPVILAVSLFLVFQGVRVHQVPNPKKPNVHFRALIESQSKVAQTGVEKQLQPFDSHRYAGLIVPPSFPVSTRYSEDRRSGSIVISAFPSRASPVSHA